VTDQEKRHAKRGVKKLEMYRKVFSGPDGEWVLNDLMSAHSMLNSTFNGNVRDMLLREGERNVVLRILTILKSSPEDLRERIRLHEQEMGE
jgi:hypothetical protein